MLVLNQCVECSQKDEMSEQNGRVKPVTVCVHMRVPAFSVFQPSVLVWV